MVVVSERLRRQLKKPLGRLYGDVKRIAVLRTGRRVISVGDMCTLALLRAGMRPHLAVFDFKCMRKRLAQEDRNLLMHTFRIRKTYSNPSGTVSEKILADAQMLIEMGGAILIRGEEDLTTLAFILAADKLDIILYGQPKKGIVLVKPGKILKKKIALSLSLL